MIYGSICSGVGSCRLASAGLDWTCAFFAEIEPFPSAVLAHHFPEVPNYGDFTQIGESAGPIDILVGGTPCQSFSVAGKRAGLDSPNGNLAIEFARLAQRLRARWIVWENVPGVLSSWSDAGEDAGEVSPTLRSLDFDKSHANGGGQVAVAIADRTGGAPDAVASALTEQASNGDSAPCVACDMRGRDEGAQLEGPHDTANIRSSAGGSSRSYLAEMSVRRLTPRECERLQGYPDDWTLVPYNGKPAKDAPRYRAIGNGWAVPVVAWIFRRIDAVERCLR